MVHTIWRGSWDLRGQPDHTTQLVSDPCVNLVFEVGDGGREARIVGVWTRLWERTLSGQGRVYGVKLRAGAVRTFIDVGAYTLTNRITPLAAFETRHQALLDAVERWGDGREPCTAICDWLRCIRRPTDDEVARAMAAAALIDSDPTILDVAALAERTNTSVRTLQRRFREHVGATPKLLIRRRRLQEAAVRIDRGERENLARLAAELGYADHAHLTRDFTALVGRPPSAVRAQA